MILTVGGTQVMVVDMVELLTILGIVGGPILTVITEIMFEVDIIEIGP